MTSCSVPGCDSQSKTHPNHKFYRLPVSPDTRERWLRLLGSPESLARTLYVCSKHFEPHSYVLRRNTQFLAPRAVPTLFMPLPIDEKLKVETSEILVCRVCLAADARLYGARETEMEDAFLNLTGAPLTQDGLPSHLCSLCYTELSKCASFRDRCRRAQELLETLREWGPLKMTDIAAIDRHSHNLTRNLTLANVHKFDSCENIVQNHCGLENEEFHNIPSTMPKTEENDDANDIEFSSKVENYDGEIEIRFENCAEDTNNPLGDKIGEAIEGNMTDTVNLDDTNFEVLHEETVDFGEEINLQIDNCEDLTKSNEVRKESSNFDVKVSTKPGKVKRNIIKKTKSKSESDVTATTKDPKVKRKTAKKTESQNITRRKVIGGEMYPCFDYEAFEKECKVKIKLYTLEEQKLEVEARKASDNYSNSPYRCEMCGRGFNFQNSFDNHMKYHDPKIGPYECQVCHFYCATSCQLTKHGTKHRISFTCLECGHVTRGERSIARIHFETHRGATFACPHCDKVCRNKTNYVNHKRFVHSSRNVPCEECGDTFLSRRGLNLHKMLSHRRCDESYADASSYDFHRHRKHSACVCEICGKVLKNQLKLKYHVARHNPVKSFSCPKCDKAFSEKLNLTIHLRRHSGERPYKCEQCPRAFNQPSNLKRHTKVVHLGQRQEYPCDICGKTLTTPSTLKVHIDQVHRKIPYKKRNRRKKETKIEDEEAGDMSE